MLQLFQSLERPIKVISIINFQLQFFLTLIISLEIRDFETPRFYNSQYLTKQYWNFLRK
jgi:hypothetical protein